MGAIQINSKGDGGWGIPNCYQGDGCDPGSEAKFSSQGQNYTGTQASLPVSFKVISGPAQPENRKLEAILVEFINGTSPYPFGRVNGLGIGPRSTLWNFWTHAFNPGSQFVEFAVTYSATNKSISNIIGAPEGALSGSILTIYKQPPAEKSKYVLNKLGQGFALNWKSFNISPKKNIKMAPLSQTKNIGSQGCVYPEGSFYFAVQNQQEYELFNKRINYILCKQETPCRGDDVDISKGPELSFMVTYEVSAAATISTTAYIKPESYLIKKDGVVKPMVAHPDKLFDAGGQCEGADFAVGRLFLFEYELSYNIDIIRDRNSFTFTKVNQIVMDPPPKPASSSSSSKSSGSDSSASTPSGKSSSSGGSSSTSGSGSQPKNSSWEWILIAVIIIVIVIIMIVLALVWCRRRAYQDEDEEGSIDEESSTYDGEKYAKIMT